MNLPSLFRQKSVEPFRSLSRMQNELERLFEGMSDRFPEFANGDFSPSCEFSEDKANYIVKFDMPGVKEDDVKIELDGNQLMVTAERREEKMNEDKKQRYSEISYGTYQRIFTLPKSVNGDKVIANFDDGVLTLTMPKAQSSSAKQIPIKH
jgi:HSP20 family protein